MLFTVFHACVFDGTHGGALKNLHFALKIFKPLLQPVVILQHLLMMRSLCLNVGKQLLLLQIKLFTDKFYISKKKHEE